MCMDDEDGIHSVLFFGGSEGRCCSAILSMRQFSGLLFNRDQWGNRCDSDWRDGLGRGSVPRPCTLLPRVYGQICIAVGDFMQGRE